MTGRRSSADERELALSALQACDAGEGREGWVRVSMAAKSAGISYDDWLAWCETGANFSGAADCRDVWNSISSRGAITAATLFGLAQVAGWEPPPRFDFSSAVRAPSTGVSRRAASVGPPKADAPPPPELIQRRDALLKAAKPADSLHPYLVRKQIGAENLLQMAAEDVKRVLGYAPEAKDEALTGRCLLVPLVDVYGQLQTFELIDESGRKTALAKLPRKGAFWLSDPTALDDRVALIGIAEGLATALTLEQAAGHPVIAVGSWGNMGAVALAVADAYPAAEIVIYPDRGEAQEAKAAAIARAVLGRSVPLPARCPQGWDYNDLAVAEGVQTAHDWIRPRLLSPGVRVSFGAALQRGMIGIDEILPGLPRGTLGLLVGQGAVGKTMLALEVAAGLALGRDLMGGQHFLAPVTRTQRRVALLLGEDSYEQIHNRLVSLAEAFRLSHKDVGLLDSNLRVLALDGHDMRVVTVGRGKMPEPGAFLPIADRVCRAADLVFLDPLVRLHDSDENDNTAASALMLELAKIAKKHQCAIVNLHHVPKAATGAKGDWRSARGAAAYSTSSRWQVLIAPADDGQGLSETAIHAALVKHNYCAPKPRFGLERCDGGVLLFTPTSQPVDQPAAKGGPTHYPSSPARPSMGTGRGYLDDLDR